MFTVLIVAAQSGPHAGLVQALREERIGYAVALATRGLPPTEPGAHLDAVVIDLSALYDTPYADAVALIAGQCRELGVPLFCALPAAHLGAYDALWGATDFFSLPPAPGEISARIRQAAARDHRQAEGEKVLRVADLHIDLERYEVFNRGRRVELTFKEYQLLCLLASNPGRAFTRESLLSQIWQYDYYGGTRTVDVHVRRLRSKLEDPGESLIETVWNVGYRFRAPEP